MNSNFLRIFDKREGARRSPSRSTKNWEQSQSDGFKLRNIFLLCTLQIICIVTSLLQESSELSVTSSHVLQCGFMDVTQYRKYASLTTVKRIQCSSIGLAICNSSRMVLIVIIVLMVVIVILVNTMISVRVIIVTTIIIYIIIVLLLVRCQL